jgi:hypothetical protein
MVAQSHLRPKDSETPSQPISGHGDMQFHPSNPKSVIIWWAAQPGTKHENLLEKSQKQNGMRVWICLARARP